MIKDNLMEKLKQEVLKKMLNIRFVTNLLVMGFLQKPV